MKNIYYIPDYDIKILYYMVLKCDVLKRLKEQGDIALKLDLLFRIGFCVPSDIVVSEKYAEILEKYWIQQNTK